MIRLKDLLFEASVGDTITIPKGIGYTLTDPESFRRSDGNVKGTVTAVQNGKVYFKVDGRQAYTRADLVETVAPKWKTVSGYIPQEDMFDYPRDPKTGAPAWGTPEMAKHLKSLRSGLKHGMPTIKGGKVVCSTCGKEYIEYPGGGVHPGTPAAEYLYKKGIIKQWK